MNEAEVTQMLRDAIDQDPKGRVWHVNTKHLITFAHRVADKTKRELESSPEESCVKFYEDRIAHLDDMLVKAMDMNRVLMEKLSGDQQLIDKYQQEAWERRLNSQRVEKEDQRKAARITTQEEWEAKIYKNYNKEDQEKWDEYIYEQGEVKEDQKKADEAAWSEGRIQCAAIRDAALDAAGEDSRAISKVYSDYVAACLAIDDHWDAVKAKREAWGV
jgi:hypothetical protein